MLLNHPKFGVKLSKYGLNLVSFYVNCFALVIVLWLLEFIYVILKSAVHFLTNSLKSLLYLWKFGDTFLSVVRFNVAPAEVGSNFEQQITGSLQEL